MYVLSTITTLHHFSVVGTLFRKQDVVREHALHLLPALPVFFQIVYPSDGQYPKQISLFYTVLFPIPNWA